MKHWFTFGAEPEVPPTNNDVENDLKEHISIRKIIGTLGNEKGMYILETIMTAIETWKKRGCNCLAL